MKVVIDVNVWISGLLWGGLPGDVIHLVRGGQLISYVSFWRDWYPSARSISWTILQLKEPRVLEEPGVLPTEQPAYSPTARSASSAAYWSVPQTPSCRRHRSPSRPSAPWRRSGCSSSLSEL